MRKFVMLNVKLSVGFKRLILCSGWSNYKNWPLVFPTHCGYMWNKSNKAPVLLYYCVPATRFTKQGDNWRVWGEATSFGTSSAFAVRTLTNSSRQTFCGYALKCLPNTRIVGTVRYLFSWLLVQRAVISASSGEFAKFAKSQLLA